MHSNKFSKEEKTMEWCRNNNLSDLKNETNDSDVPSTWWSASNPKTQKFDTH